LITAVMPFAAEAGQQPVEPLHLHVGVALGDLAQHPGPLIDGEQGFLGDVDEHRDDHLVIQARGPADDVGVAVRDRIERTWAYHSLHSAVTPPALAPRRRSGHGQTASE
jgi:hypothetical protein